MNKENNMPYSRPVCAACDNEYEPSDRDLAVGFCESCGDVIDNDDFIHILLEKTFDAECVEVVFHA